LLRARPQIYYQYKNNQLRVKQSGQNVMKLHHNSSYEVGKPNYEGGELNYEGGKLNYEGSYLNYEAS
jgi:hypothetical protein